MCGQCGPGFAAQTGDDVERPLGQATGSSQFGDLQQRKAGIFSRFDDTGIARRKCRAHRAAEDLHRVIPRNDVAGHAVRFTQGEHGVAGLIRQGLAMQLVAGAGVVLEIAGAGGGISPRLLHRLAGITALEECQFIGMGKNCLCQLHHQAAALDRVAAAPGALARQGARTVACARSPHRYIHVPGIAPGDVGEDLAIGRIEHGQGRAGRGGQPAVANEMGSLRRRGHRK